MTVKYLPSAEARDGLKNNEIAREFRAQHVSSHTGDVRQSCCVTGQKRETEPDTKLVDIPL